jgi:PEGA domain
MMRRIVLGLAAVALAGGVSGCVERRYVIESDPPGALVLVNGQPIGTTPVDGYYEWYGNYAFTLIKDGYETQTFNKRFVAPWFEYPPFDFVSENLYPAKIEDVRRVCFPLTPVTQMPTADLLQKADELRNRGRALGRERP